MTKAKVSTPVPANDKARITFTITGHYELDENDSGECIDNLREAMEKLRECGSAECAALIPAHTEEL